MKLKIFPGLIVSKIIIFKNDNINDQDIDGYEIDVELSNGSIIRYIEYKIDDLESKPYGIYKFNGNEYEIIENWEE